MWRTIWRVADEATPARGRGFGELDLDLDFSDREGGLVGFDLAFEWAEVEFLLAVRVGYLCAV